MSYETDNRKPLYEIVSAFEIVEQDEKCFECDRQDDCIARKVFNTDFQHSIIKKCKHFKPYM